MATLRLLTRDDLSSAATLVAHAGWNQTDEDWSRFLRRAPGACFAVDDGGELVATATTTSYGDRFGWVSMVLVHPEHRRRGHGTRVFEAAVDALVSRGVTPALDATPAGRAVYEPRGFVPMEDIERWIGVSPAGLPESREACPASADAMAGLAALDLEAFGADRRDLLADLLALAPGACFTLVDGTRSGFVLARPGRRFTQVGPVVATGIDVAVELLLRAVAALEGGPIGIDVPSRHGVLRDVLRGLGFSVERRLTRMALPAPETRAAAPPGGRLDRIFAIAGPEWG